MMKLLIAVIALSAFVLVNADDEKPTFPIKALALISGRVHRNETKRPVLIHGEMRFIQESEDSPVVIKLNLTSTPRDNSVFNRTIGSHFHLFGVSDGHSESAIACNTTGAHYNPKSAIPKENVETGELGNYVFTPVEGVLRHELTVPKIKLYGAESMIGRSFVFHERPDEMIRDADGKFLKFKVIKRIACGSIVYAKP